jgi:hypothetical protein
MTTTTTIKLGLGEVTIGGAWSSLRCDLAAHLATQLGLRPGVTYELTATPQLRRVKCLQGIRCDGAPAKGWRRCPRCGEVWQNARTVCDTPGCEDLFLTDQIVPLPPVVDAD